MMLGISRALSASLVCWMICTVALVVGSCDRPGWWTSHIIQSGGPWSGPYPTDTIVSYICRTGYKGGGSIICQSDGRWSHKPICVAVGECDDPGYVSHSHREYLNHPGPYPPGTVIDFRCDPGYHGGGPITCQSDGQWDQASTPCTRDGYCANPATVLHSTRTGESTPFQTNTILTFTCSPGFSGGGSITCQSDGQWTELPTCVAIGGTTTTSQPMATKRAKAEPSRKDSGSEEQQGDKEDNNLQLILIISGTVVVIIILVAIFIVFLLIRRKKSSDTDNNNQSQQMEFVRGNATSENGDVISNNASDVRTGNLDEGATVYSVTDTTDASPTRTDSEQQIQHPYQLPSYDSH